MRGAANEWDGGVPQYLMERLMMQPCPLQGALWTAILCAIAGHHELGGRPGVCKDQDCRRERKGTCRLGGCLQPKSGNALGWARPCAQLGGRWRISLPLPQAEGCVHGPNVRSAEGSISGSRAGRGGRRCKQRGGAVEGEPEEHAGS
jgi:hypothetical protein